MNYPKSTRPRVVAAVKTGKAGAKSKAQGAPASRTKHAVAQHAEALVEAGRMSYAGIEAVLQRHVDILRATLAELSTVGQVMRQVGVRESIGHLDQLAYGAVELTLKSVSELAGLAATKQREALQILAARLHDDLAEFRRLRSEQAPNSPH